MTRVRHLAGVAAVICGAIVLLSLLPLGTAFQFSRDEGYEVMKAFLCTKGYRLYGEIWNDQPPVHTMILAGAFKLWGPSILTARLVAVGFGVLLLAVFHQVVRQRCSAWCALVATFLFACSPNTLKLCGSAMLEAPAFAVALISSLLAMRWRSRGHWGWLVASGATMGLALQTKFTAALVMPAVLAELVVRVRPESATAGKDQWGVPIKPGEGPPSRPAAAFDRRRTAANALVWSASFAAVLCIIGLTWAKGSLMSSWKSHFQEGAAAQFDSPADYRFNASLLVMHMECIFAAVAGLAWGLASKRVREVGFPAVLLATAALIHSVHRPWWDYYYLHLAIPVAWLAGWAVCEAGGAAFSVFGGPRLGFGSAKGVWAVVLCGLAAAVLSRGEVHLESTVAELRRSPAISANRLLAVMRKNTAGTHWIYAEPVIYAFYVRLPVPPDLAVVVAKRFWSGQISSDAIVATCKRYRPEQIVLPNGPRGAAWQEFLGANYTLSSVDGDCSLYISKELAGDN